MVTNISQTVTRSLRSYIFANSRHSVGDLSCRSIVLDSAAGKLDNCITGFDNRLFKMATETSNFDANVFIMNPKETFMVF